MSSLKSIKSVNSNAFGRHNSTGGSGNEDFSSSECLDQYQFTSQKGNYKKPSSNGPQRCLKCEKSMRLVHMCKASLVEMAERMQL